MGGWQFERWCWRTMFVCLFCVVFLERSIVGCIQFTVFRWRQLWRIFLLTDSDFSMPKFPGRWLSCDPAGQADAAPVIMESQGYRAETETSALRSILLALRNPVNRPDLTRPLRHRYRRSRRPKRGVGEETRYGPHTIIVSWSLFLLRTASGITALLKSIILEVRRGR